MIASFFVVSTVAFSQVPPRPPERTAAPLVGGAQRVALERLVRAPNVLAALGVDDAAKANLKLLADERDEQSVRVRRLVELAPGPKRTKLLAESIATPASSPAKVVETLKEILGEEKFKRLQQIQRQLLGPAVVFESANELGLTPDQRSHLAEIVRAEAERVAEDGPAFRLPDGRGGERLVAAKQAKDGPELRQRQLAELRKALTVEQQRLLDELLGAPSGVVSKELAYDRQYGRAKAPYVIWQNAHFSGVVFLGVPEVRNWLELANWRDIENHMVEENDIDAVLAFTVERLPSADAEELAHRALMTKKPRMFKLEEAVYRLMSARQALRLNNLKYQASNSAPYSWPTADLLGVTEKQRGEYTSALFKAVEQMTLSKFDHWRFLTPEQRKKWDELRGEPVPQNLLRLCAYVKDSRWRPQLREGLAAKLQKD